MKKLLLDLLGSKKVMLSLATAVLGVLSVFGLDIPIEKVQPFLALGAILVAAIGAADLGKEKTKLAIEAEKELASEPPKP